MEAVALSGSRRPILQVPKDEFQDYDVVYIVDDHKPDFQIYLIIVGSVRKPDSSMKRTEKQTKTRCA